MFERYVWRVIMPYFLLAWLLLTVILFLQQGSRFSQILFGVNVPAKLIIELGLALIVSVIVFTGPMALLTGIVIGLSQLRGDSELIAFESAGAGVKAILAPCLAAGLLVSGIAFLINLEGVPRAAKLARQVAFETALLKLESPIEPGVFNTEFSNYVIYVREGNSEQGVWEKVFIYLLDPGGQTRLITARSGRIDTADNSSELVLSDARVTTLPLNPQTTAVTIENVKLLRLSLNTGKKQLREKFAAVERLPEEMGLVELSRYAAQKNGQEQVEAQILWHRRLALSCAPLFLSLLGAAVSLRFGRGGRGWGSILSLATMIFYYLLSLAGEQLARVELIPAFLGGWSATIIIVSLALRWLWLAHTKIKKPFRVPTINFNFKFADKFKRNWIKRNDFTGARRLFGREIFGLLERDLLKNLGWYFVLTCLSLIALFHVFTVFEVLRGLGGNTSGAFLLVKYLLLLTPLVFWQIAPTALMIAVLVTYSVKARYLETTIWGSAGQSVYVLILPSLLSAIWLGALNWEIQERVLPQTNPRQDVLRAQLRGGAGSVGAQQGRLWIAAPEGIYSFNKEKGSDNVKASDVVFYQFETDNVNLQQLYKSQKAVWQNSFVSFEGAVNKIVWKNNFVESDDVSNSDYSIVSAENPFAQIGAKTAQLSSDELAKLVQTSDSAVETRRYRVALQQKYATLLLPLVIVFFSTPLAFFRRAGRSGWGTSIGLTVGSWLLFIAVSNFFERFGIEGVLPPAVAVWSPLIVFSSLGWYLLAKTRY